MTVFLDAPQRFDNLAAIARTLDAFGFGRCLVHDPFRLVRARYGKARRRVAVGVSGGAFDRVAFERVGPGALAEAPGRVVVAVPDDEATALPAFAFRPDDTLVFGSESQGVSDAARAHADAFVTVPQRGGESLNLGVAVAVVLYEAVRQHAAP